MGLTYGQGLPAAGVQSRWAVQPCLAACLECCTQIPHCLACRDGVHPAVPAGPCHGAASAADDGQHPLHPWALPQSLGGFPADLLRSLAATSEDRLRVLEGLPPELRRNDRCLSSDVVELFFAVLHGKCGIDTDATTLLGFFATLIFLAWLAAMPEEARGFPMAPRSKA